MTPYCLFIKDDQSSKPRWRCVRCGFVTHKGFNKEPRRVCSGPLDKTTHHYLTCPNRGHILATINARSAGCGCSSTTVDVYQCRRFNEPVLKQAAERCREDIAAKVPGYTGRTCRECNIPCKPETLPDIPPAQQTIAIIVTCHNYGRFLRQCLDSILAQTVQPSTIILVDDASSDDTPAIASEYAQRGVRYERVEYRNASKGRNHGMTVAGKPQFFLFVDADNWLPPNYLAELLRHAADPSIGVVYCRLWYVNEQGEGLRWSPDVRPFSLASLRKQNLVDTCSLVRRQALEQVNGWSPLHSVLQDYDLWLRIAEAGWRFHYTESTALNYRLHPARMSEHLRGTWSQHVDIMRQSQLTGMVTLFSGRRWSLGRWFHDLRALWWNKRNLHLVAVDNSRDVEFTRELKDQLENCGVTYTYLRDDSRIIEDVAADRFTDSAQQRTQNVIAMNVHLARLYSLATRYLPTSAANVWSVEDDVGFPPDTLEVLATELYRLRAVAVSGCLRNRFTDHKLLAWTGPSQWVTKIPVQSIKVTGTGFYCLLARRDSWDRIAWRAGTTGDRHPYYDWAACRDLQQDGPIYLAPMRCRHWQADGTVLDV